MMTLGPGSQKVLMSAQSPRPLNSLSSPRGSSRRGADVEGFVLPFAMPLAFRKEAWANKEKIYTPTWQIITTETTQTATTVKKSPKRMKLNDSSSCPIDSSTISLNKTNTSQIMNPDEQQQENLEENEGGSSSEEDISDETFYLRHDQCLHDLRVAAKAALEKAKQDCKEFKIQERQARRATAANGRNKNLKKNLEKVNSLSNTKPSSSSSSSSQLKTVSEHINVAAEVKGTDSGVPPMTLDNILRYTVIPPIAMSNILSFLRDNNKKQLVHQDENQSHSVNVLATPPVTLTLKTETDNVAIIKAAEGTGADEPDSPISQEDVEEEEEADEDEDEADEDYLAEMEMETNDNEDIQQEQEPEQRLDFELGIEKDVLGDSRSITEERDKNEDQDDKSLALVEGASQVLKEEPQKADAPMSVATEAVVPAGSAPVAPVTSAAGDQYLLQKKRKDSSADDTVETESSLNGFHSIPVERMFNYDLNKSLKKDGNRYRWTRPTTWIRPLYDLRFEQPAQDPTQSESAAQTSSGSKRKSTSKTHDKISKKQRKQNNNNNNAPKRLGRPPNNPNHRRGAAATKKNSNLVKSTRERKSSLKNQRLDSTGTSRTTGKRQDKSARTYPDCKTSRRKGIGRKSKDIDSAHSFDFAQDHSVDQYSLDYSANINNTHPSEEDFAESVQVRRRNALLKLRYLKLSQRLCVLQAKGGEEPLPDDFYATIKSLPSSSSSSSSCAQSSSSTKAKSSSSSSPLSSFLSTPLNQNHINEIILVPPTSLTQALIPLNQTQPHINHTNTRSVKIKLPKRITSNSDTESNESENKIFPIAVSPARRYRTETNDISHDFALTSFTGEMSASPCNVALTPKLHELEMEADQLGGVDDMEALFDANERDNEPTTTENDVVKQDIPDIDITNSINNNSKSQTVLAAFLSAA